MSDPYVRPFMKRNLDESVVRLRKRVKTPPAECVFNTFTHHQINKITKSLITFGYAVVTPVKKASIDLSATRSCIDNEIHAFREYLPGASDRSPLGGFAAYNNPSSFHNPTVRRLRIEAYNIISPILHNLAQKIGNGFKKEALIDRLVVRPANRSPSAKSWHRFRSPAAAADDIVFGGWWNFDDKCQQFSCIPCTHTDVVDDSGYTVFKDKNEIERYNHSKHYVNIPPGAIIIFNEKLIREVVSVKRAYKSYCLLLGWRITKTNTPLMGNTLWVQLEKQAAVTTKDGRDPPMWSELHWTNWFDKLKEYSTLFNAACHDSFVVKHGGWAGGECSIVHRNMKSLHSYGFDLYAPYTAIEKNILQPH